MKTVISSHGIEVSYPCVIHLLRNGENYECEYKSDHMGRDLLEFICKIQGLQNPEFFGLRFLESCGIEEKRVWLDLDKLVKPQVKLISPMRFYFRVKVYPPEPYRFKDVELKHQIYQQLRLDLLSGRLFCEANEAAMLTALILQNLHGNYNKKCVNMYINDIENRIIRRERTTTNYFTATRDRALELYQALLGDLTKFEIEDMFLRLASRLESYGVEPFYVKSIEKKEVTLWINYKGLAVYGKKRNIHNFEWTEVDKINHLGENMIVKLVNESEYTFQCFNKFECKFIWSVAVDHLNYFGKMTTKNTNDVYALYTQNEDLESHVETIYESQDFDNNTTYSFGEEDEGINNLAIAKSLISDINLKSSLKWLGKNYWYLYIIFLLYLMGSQATILTKVPYFHTVKEFIGKYLLK